MKDTLARFDALLSKVSYKPGTRISRPMWSIRGDMVEIQVSHLVQDAAGEHGEVPITSVLFVVPEADDKCFYMQLFITLERLAVHEVTEWFKVDGKCWIDPHPELTQTKTEPAPPDGA